MATGVTLVFRQGYGYSVGMTADIPVVTLLEAGTAAEELGVSASGLRRLSLIYEEVYEELPRKPKSNNRMWPQEAIERLKKARALLQVKRYGTIQEALEAIKHGLADEVEIEVPVQDSTQQALHVLIEEVRRLRSEVQELKESRVLPTETREIEKDSVESATPSNDTQEGMFSRIGSRIDRLFSSFSRKS